VTTGPHRIAGRLDGGIPLLLTVAHSGRLLPSDFASPLSARQLRALEDPHVDRLLLPAATATAAPLLAARYARAVIDLNRAESDHDPAMVAGRLDVPARPSARTRAGLGLLPRLAAGRPVHDRPISAVTAMERIRTLHRPFHRAIACGLARARQAHGFAILVDCHSMPTPAAPPRADVVVGDCHGRAAAPELRDWLCRALAAEGLAVSVNDPYAGGDIIARHSAPLQGIHAVQLEFDRRLYLDPATLRPAAGFGGLAASISRLMTGLIRIAPMLALAPEPPALAAE
jgi:N-formylglutamate deformylase